MAGQDAETRKAAQDHAQRLRERLDKLRRTFQQTYLAKPALKVVHKYSDGVARLLRDHIDAVAQRPGCGDAAGKMAVVAVGGFGRRELSHYSDMDFTFLTASEVTEEGQEFIRAVLYPLWDLRLDLGYNVGTVEDCLEAVGTDLPRTTSLLAARHVWGDRKLASGLTARLHEKVHKEQMLWFVESLRKEKEIRYQRYGDTPLLLEPDLKNSAGCLRGLHEILWLAFASFGEMNLEVLAERNLISAAEKDRLVECWEFLLRLRNALHFAQNRRGDRLTLERQIQVAEILGYRKSGGSLAEEHLMRAFYDHASHVQRLTERLFEKCLTYTHGTPEYDLEQKPPRRIDRDFGGKGWKIWLEQRGLPTVENDPHWPLRLFLAGAREGLRPTDGTLRRIEEHLHLVTPSLRRSAQAKDLFLTLLDTPGNLAPTLRAMNRCGYLSVLFPEFSAVRNLPKIDHYHQYTVDEHLIRTVAFCERLMVDPVPRGMEHVAEEARRILRLDLLNMSLLFHDLGKGEGKGHVIHGMHAMQRITERMRFRPVEREVLRLLVANHQKMSHMALRRDPADPSIAEELAESVGSPELLRMLYVHTACDLGGVSPESWNDWRGHLLRMLYEKTMARLGGPDAARETGIPEAAPFVEQVWRAGVEWFGEQKAPGRDEIEHFLSDLPERYHRSVLPEDALTHYLLSSELTPERRIRCRKLEPEGSNYVEITFVAHDAPNLFSNLCGALASKRFNILSAQIYTAYSGEAVDVFQVDVPRALRPDLDMLLERICSQMNQVLRTGESFDWMRSVENREYVPLTPDRLEMRPPQVDIKNDLSPTHTVVEVRAPDRPGLLSDMARVFDDLLINVELAFIATESYQVVDVFYVTDLETNKIRETAKLKRLREALLASIHEGMTVREL